MSEAVGRSGGQAVSEAGGLLALVEAVPSESRGITDRVTPCPPDLPLCNRCGFAVTSRPWGCRNPCPNCGTVYPLGDCSD